jgi:DNA-binding NtrC family response regulator
MAPGAEHVGTHCEETCGECEYFRGVHEQDTNVLVVTNDNELGEALKASSDQVLFNLRIADCEYQCSAVLNEFKPDFVVVDSALGPEPTLHLTRHLIDDARVPFVRIVIAGKKENFPADCEKGICALIERPFSIQDISKCISFSSWENGDEVPPAVSEATRDTEAKRLVGRS